MSFCNAKIEEVMVSPISPANIQLLFNISKKLTMVVMKNTFGKL